MTFCPAILGRYIPSFDIADLMQPMVKVGCLVRSAVGRSTVEESNQRRCRLLCLRPKWPRGRRPAEQRDELAAPHSITSSARRSSDVGNSMPIAFAVLRLMTSSYLTGCSTGRSPGWAPLRIFATKWATRR